MVSDPRVASEVLHMPKVMDKNRQALVVLDTVSVCLVIAVKTLLSVKIHTSLHMHDS